MAAPSARPSRRLRRRRLTTPATVVAARRGSSPRAAGLEEDDRICADGRLLQGSLEVDVSALTGEAAPVFRSAELTDIDLPYLEARDLVFSGTSCTGCEARAVAYATAMQIELGAGDHGSRAARRSESVITGGMLVRARLFLGVLSAGLVMAGFFLVLARGGWTPGAAVGSGSHLHHLYLEATTMTFLGIVVCQVGTAFAARTEYASLRAVGVFGNRLLLWGIAFELAFAAAVVHRPPLQHVFDTAPVGAAGLLYLLPLPFLVWAPTSCAASCGGGRPAQVLLPKSRNTR